MQKNIFLILMLSAFLVGCDKDQPKPETDKISMIDVDEIDRTVKERNKSLTTTSEDMSASADDLMITQAIRQTLISNDTLSVTAKGIQINTINGVVTLKGLVENRAEKNQIDITVRSMSGVKRLDSQLEVRGFE